MNACFGLGEINVVPQPGTRLQASQRDERGTRRDVQSMTAPFHLQESRALTAADSVREVIEAVILENHQLRAVIATLTARTEEQQHAQRWPS